MYKLTFLRKFAILIKSKDIDGSFERVDQIFSMHYAGKYPIFFSACIRRGVLYRDMPCYRKQICCFGLIL